MRKNPQMDVASMLKSKDTLVPFRNLIFGKRWSFTAMEKATALPLRDGFMPNSPMPMLDVSDWLLLTTVSTTGSGILLAPLPGLEVLPLLFDLVFAESFCRLPRFIVNGRVFGFMVVLVVVVNLCCVCLDFESRHC
jgi:hypothetical protein